MLNRESIVRNITGEKEVTELLLSAVNETSVARQFSLPQETKLKLISHYFRSIMQAIGLDTNSNELDGVPERVVNLYLKEIFSGADPVNKPVVNLLENKSGYSEMIVEKNIRLSSWCEFYFVPFEATAHVAYISKGKTIISPQLKQLLQYQSSKLQTREKLTEEIAVSLKECLGVQDVAVLLENVRYLHEFAGNQNSGSSSTTAHFSGKFQNEDTRREFFAFLK